MSVGVGPECVACGVSVPRDDRTIRDGDVYHTDCAPRLVADGGQRVPFERPAHEDDVAVDDLLLIRRVWWPSEPHAIARVVAERGDGPVLDGPAFQQPTTRGTVEVLDRVPATRIIGRDHDDHCHLVDHDRDRILVLDPDAGDTLAATIVHEQDLDGRDVSEWVAFVEQDAFEGRAGWRRDQLRNRLRGIVDRIRDGDSTVDREGGVRA